MSVKQKFVISAVAALMVLGLAPAATAEVVPLETPTVDHTCRTVPGTNPPVPVKNSGPDIEALLANNNVVVHGTCSLAWTRLSRNSQYWKTIEIPNNRTLSGDAVLYLHANQTVIPKNPNGTADTRFGDIITEKASPAEGITVSGSLTIDGKAAEQKAGYGYDGVQFRNCLNCTVWGVTVNNIRGVDALGGRTESFAVDFHNCRGGCNVVQVEVGVTSAGNKAKSSSGISANGGADVTITSSKVIGLHGRCFTSWKADRVTRINNIGDRCDSAAFANEWGTGHIDQNNWYVNSGKGLALKSVKNWRGTGMVIGGNTGSAVTLNGAASPDVDVCDVVYLGGQVGPHVKILETFNAGCGHVDDQLIRK